MQFRSQYTLRLLQRPPTVSLYLLVALFWSLFSGAAVESLGCMQASESFLHMFQRLYADWRRLRRGIRCQRAPAAKYHLGPIMGQSSHE
jgi:hypothetical protein